MWFRASSRDGDSPTPDEIAAAVIEAQIELGRERAPLILKLVGISSAGTPRISPSSDPRISWSAGHRYRSRTQLRHDPCAQQGEGACVQQALRQAGDERRCERMPVGVT
jgi:hypothetical protein